MQNEPTVGAIPAAYAEAAARAADALVSLACAHCSHDNFAASQYCDRCQRPLRAPTRVPIPATPHASYGDEVAAAPSPTEHPKNLPPHLLRVGAALAIDGAMIVAYAFAVLRLAMYMTDRAVGLSSFASWVHSRPNVSSAVLLCTLAGAVVYTACGARWRSPGRLVAGIRIISTNGSDLSWHKALVRSLVAVISAIPCGAGVWWCLGQRNGRTWHDIIVGTRPIRS